MADGDVTNILRQIESGDPSADADKLLPLVYDELRRMARARMAHERADHTLQPTALVHEAYLRLVGEFRQAEAWDGRGHFFAAAAEAMRRILIENARRKASLKRGGNYDRIDLSDLPVRPDRDQVDLLALDDALSGPVNAVAPHPVTNREFTATLGRVLGRPTVLPLPAAMVGLLFGEMGQALLLEGARVRPTRLEASGFRFRYPRLEEALRAELSGTR